MWRLDARPTALVVDRHPRVVILSLVKLASELRARHWSLAAPLARLLLRGRGHPYLLRRVSSRRLAHVVFPSEAWRARAVASGLPPAAAHTIYFGTDVPDSPPSVVASSPFLLFVGRLAPDKGLHVILAPLLRLAQRFAPPDDPWVTFLAGRSFPSGAYPVARTAGLRVALATRLGVGLSWTGRRVVVRFDRAVARRLVACPPDAFVGMPCSSLYSLRAARAAGGVSFLYVNMLPWERNAVLAREAETAPTAAMRAEARTDFQEEASIARFELELASAHCVFAQSAFALRVLGARGVPPERLVYLPSGVDLDRYAGSARDGVPRPLRVLYVGRVEYRKGLRFLGEAVAEATDAVESLTVVGPEAPRARALRESMPFARFVGMVGPAEVARRYAEADVLVLPSLCDSMGRVVLEAMASGLPVVITSSCGAAGFMEDGVQGFIVPPRDPGAIANRLRLLAMTGDLRQRMGRAARATAEEYSWERFDSSFRAAFDERCARNALEATEGRPR